MGNRAGLDGFGVTRLGMWVLRFPVIASLALVVVTLVAVAGLPKIGYSGANIDILRDGSREIAYYDGLLSSFRNFNNDAVVLVRSPDLATVEGIETYRDLHFEFQFDERVQSVLSLFSLVQYDSVKGGWHSAVPARFEDDSQVEAFLTKLSEDIPNSQSLLGAGHDSAVMVVYAKPEAVSDARVRETIDHFHDLAARFHSENVSVTIAGQPAIRSGLITDIVGDLLKFLPVAILFCAIIAWAIFRSLPAMVITAAAPLVSVVWLMGGMGLAGIDINFLTNILPVLLMVIVFADALHLYLKWEALARESDDPAGAIGEAVETIGPACTLSVITTALALFSLVLSGNNGLSELGIIGGLGVIASLVAVIVGLPLCLYWAVRLGYRPSPKGPSRLVVVATPAIRLLTRPKTVISVGMVILLIGIVGHYRIDSRFQLVDYLSSTSSVADSEGFIDERYPGSTPLFAVVALDDDKPMLAPAHLERFYGVLDSIGKVFPASSFYSLADFKDEIEKGGGEIRESDIEALPDYLTSRFISKDRRQVLITIFSSANLSASEMQAMLARLHGDLATKDLDRYVTLTGYPILASVVAPRLMDNLRISLLAAIVMSIVLITIAARSWRNGLACLIPNLLPILCVETVLWLSGTPLNMSVAVSLTVAFGLAVNDSIHLLNQYLIGKAALDNRPAMELALRQVFPAMLSTTLILSGGLAIMLLSSLPAITLFSAVMILTLILALLFDVLQLPAQLLMLDR